MDAPEKLRNLLEQYLPSLRSLLIVSQVELTDRKEIAEPYESAEYEGLVIGVSRARGEKCNRCWNYSETVGADAEHPDICERCRNNL